MTKKRIIFAIMSAIGFGFIIFATFNFIVKIPDLVHQISEIEENLNEMDKAQIVLDIYTATTVLADQNVNLGLLVNPFNQPINEYLHKKGGELMINKIFTHDIIKKGYVDMDYYNQLFEMNQTELLIAEEKMSYSPYLIRENKKLNILRTEKSDTQYYSAIFQITGLSLAQFVIIAELLLKKEKRDNSEPKAEDKKVKNNQKNTEKKTTGKKKT